MNKNYPTFTYDHVVTVGVDVQNDFCPGGSLAVPDGDAVIAPLNKVMDYTRDNGGSVVLTRDWHPASTPHFETWPVHCVAETNGAEFHRDLDILPTDLIINKGTGQTDGYSGFEGESEDHIAIADVLLSPYRQRIALLIGGLATDYCVKQTVLDACDLARTIHAYDVDKKIEVYAIKDAMRAVNLQPGDEQDALNEMQRAGAHIMTSQEIINSIAREQEN